MPQWSSLPAAPAQAEEFRSDDLDEVREFVRRFDGEHSRTVHGCGPLAYRRWVLSGMRTKAVWAESRLTQTIRGSLRVPCIHWAAEAGASYLIGRRRWTLRRGDLLLIPPQWEFTRRAGGPALAVGLHTAALAAEISARRGRLDGRVGGWSALACAAEATPLAGALAVLAAALHEGDAVRREHAEARVVEVAAELVLTRSAPLPAAGAVAQVRIAQLAGWIDVHCTEPLTLGRLCAQAGVGGRTLQAGFQARYGVSPMQFVAQRRLAAVQRRLYHALPGDEVTRVALAAGFTHLGRFAAGYRRLFGEAPSQTLRRARGR